MNEHRIIVGEIIIISKISVMLSTVNPEIAREKNPNTEEHIYHVTPFVCSC